jgi:hypothetical protein
MTVLDFKKRSVGDVPAPETKVLSAQPRVGGPRVRVREDSELVEKLATSVERAAVLKYLRAEYGELKTLIGVIERGDHRER